MPNTYSGATEEDMVCPGCGAFSLTTITTLLTGPYGAAPRSFHVCVNPNCEWVGNIVQAPEYQAVIVRAQVPRGTRLDW